jgi:hypothetical protein
LSGIDRGADAGEHGASEQRGAVEPDILIDLHQCVLVNEHLLGIGRQADELT